MNKQHTALEILTHLVEHLDVALKHPPSAGTTFGAAKIFDSAFQRHWKALRDQLTSDGVPHEDTPASVLRAASQHGLLNNLADWEQFIDLYTRSVAINDAHQAQTIIGDLPLFTTRLKESLQHLKDR